MTGVNLNKFHLYNKITLLSNMVFGSIISPLAGIYGCNFPKLIFASQNSLLSCGAKPFGQNIIKIRQ